MGMRSIKFLLVVAFALTAGACTSGEGATGVPSLPGTASSTPGATGDDAFAKCMKDNGVDIDTPDEEGGTRSQGTSSPGDRGRYEEALDKCRKFMPEGGANERPSEEDLRKAVEFAKCMRGKGVNYPDPNPNENLGGGVARIPDGVDGNDPAVREKMRDCFRDTGGLTPETGR